MKTYIIEVSADSPENIEKALNEVIKEIRKGYESGHNYVVDQEIEFTYDSNGDY